ncbi:MAG: hypothetical protein IJ192_12450 [Clostridia bacterium]|nr:hypothetical protein [Clostridia bacterium]
MDKNQVKLDKCRIISRLTAISGLYEMGLLDSVGKNTLIRNIQNGMDLDSSIMNSIKPLTDTEINLKNLLEN